jgi:hypothetical protein
MTGGMEEQMKNKSIFGGFTTVEQSIVGCQSRRYETYYTGVVLKSSRKTLRLLLRERL